MLLGSALSGYRRIRERFPGLQLIASGGVASAAELVELRQAGCFGAIVGKAIYEGKISLEELGRLAAN
mgnify:CR=1 FL=1